MLCFYWSVWVLLLPHFEHCWGAEFIFRLFFPLLVNALDYGQFFSLFEASFPLLKTEWEMFEFGGDVASVKEVPGFYCSLLYFIFLCDFAEYISCSEFLNNWQFDTRMVLGDCKAFLDQLFDCESRRLNANVLICIFWRLTECFMLKAPKDLTLVGISMFCVFFFFFCF